jgi:hypothetical protein
MFKYHRALPRFKVSIPGKLLWDNGTLARDCIIKDLSDGGACIDTTVFVKIPDSVDLFEGKTGTIFECSVRWQREELVGLQFLDICSRTRRRTLLLRHALAVQEGGDASETRGVEPAAAGHLAARDQGVSARNAPERSRLATSPTERKDSASGLAHERALPNGVANVRT